MGGIERGEHLVLVAFGNESTTFCGLTNGKKCGITQLHDGKGETFYVLARKFCVV